MPRKPKSPSTPSRKIISRLAKTKAIKRCSEQAKPMKVYAPPRTKKIVPIHIPIRAGGPMKTKPTYIVMVMKAMKDMISLRNTVSYVAITRYIQGNYPVPTNFKKNVRVALNTAVDDGILEQVKSSFRYTGKGKRALEKKVKKKKPKPAKKPKKKTKTTRGRKPKSTTTKKRNTRKKTPTKSTKRSKASTPRSVGRKPGSPTASDPLVWVWQYNHNGWYNYKPTAGADVEEVYQEFLLDPYAVDPRPVKSGDWEYMVDFNNWQQTNTQHENHTTRKIRRVQLPQSENIFPSKRYADDL